MRIKLVDLQELVNGVAQTGGVKTYTSLFPDVCVQGGADKDECSWSECSIPISRWDKVVALIPEVELSQAGMFMPEQISSIIMEFVGIMQRVKGVCQHRLG